MTSRRKYDRDEIKRLLRSGLTHDEVAKEIGCSLTTVVITAREMWDEDGWGRVRWTKAQETALMQLVDGLADRGERLLSWFRRTPTCWCARGPRRKRRNARRVSQNHLS